MRFLTDQLSGHSMLLHTWLQVRQCMLLCVRVLLEVGTRSGVLLIKRDYFSFLGFTCLKAAPSRRSEMRHFQGLPRHVCFPSRQLVITVKQQHLAVDSFFAGKHRGRFRAWRPLFFFGFRVTVITRVTDGFVMRASGYGGSSGYIPGWHFDKPS